MPLTNCEINLILIWSQNCVNSSATWKKNLAIKNTQLYVISFVIRNVKFAIKDTKLYVIFSASRKIKFTIKDTKLYVPVVTLSTQDNSKLLKQFKKRF